MDRLGGAERKGEVVMPRRASWRRGFRRVAREGGLFWVVYVGLLVGSLAVFLTGIKACTSAADLDPYGRTAVASWAAPRGR